MQTGLFSLPLMRAILNSFFHHIVCLRAGCMRLNSCYLKPPFPFLIDGGFSVDGWCSASIS
ncbi:unnamed protein product [Hymenolepis diminuta]|uniref:Uncharacterized protein n=1 Tax=Hymenolepis diminuta TaxID=6216 RepID=A0A564XZ13_HYMDI|nr:unnamed protein product [Hymenolepis diminuta]